MRKYFSGRKIVSKVLCNTIYRIEIGHRWYFKEVIFGISPVVLKKKNIRKTTQN